MNDGWCKHTSIHTRVTSTIRISSIWREYENPHFEQYAWETIVWNGDNIDYQPETTQLIDEVMRIHKRIYDKIINGERW